VHLPEKDDLGRLMRTRGVKATELASQSEVSKGTISKILNKPNFDPSYRIMKALFETVDKISEGNSKSVESVMTSKVVTVEENESVASAKRKMLANDVSQLPVVLSGNILGLITEASILSHPGATIVKEAVIFDYAIVGKDKKVADLERLILSLQAIMVVHEEKLVGILTKADFLK
jgi:predicted transcriptional regulator